MIKEQGTVKIGVYLSREDWTEIVDSLKGMIQLRLAAEITVQLEIADGTAMVGAS